MDNSKKGRNLEVLMDVVRLYISNAAPVSSKSVAACMENNISSATVRNIMAELEEEGFIEQPHTSAGRIPTDKGYRFYVDHVNISKKIRRQRAQQLARAYALERIRSIKDIIERTSAILNRELHHAGLVMWPSIDDFYLKHVEFVQLNDRALMVILITVTNAVKNYMLELDVDIDEDVLRKVSNFINTHFKEINISRIPYYLDRILKEDVHDDSIKVVEFSKTVIEALIEKDIDNDVYYEGLDVFADGSDLMDINAVKHFLRIFSNRKEIAKFMRKELPYDGMNVYIGKENKFDLLHECSFITSGYKLSGKTVGRIGVIGPTRMDYENAIETLNYISELISLQLDNIRGC